MDALRRPEPVSRELTAVSFGFFSSEEARSARLTFRAPRLTCLLLMPTARHSACRSSSPLPVFYAVLRRLTLVLFPQALRVSVKRVTATEMLDKLDNAVPDGLYDPSMGPTDPKGELVCSSRLQSLLHRLLSHLLI
jgi:hypothetical protein